MTDQYPLFPGAWKHAPKTSHDAAAKAAPKNATIKERVASLLKSADATPEEAAAFLELDLFSVRPVFSQLRKMGKIEESGRTGKSRKGLNAAAWRWKHGA